MSALKRIEEKHKLVATTGEAYCSCGVNLLAGDCDVVKLARALDAVSQGGHDDDCLFCARKDFNAERTLEEVAGE